MHPALKGVLMGLSIGSSVFLFSIGLVFYGVIVLAGSVTWIFFEGVKYFKGN